MIAEQFSTSTGSSPIEAQMLLPLPGSEYSVNMESLLKVLVDSHQQSLFNIHILPSLCTIGNCPTSL